jgi:hypothetical protein
MIRKLTTVAALHGGLFILSAFILFLAFTPPEHGILAAFLFVGVGGCIYLLPTYVAALRNAPRFAGIFGLNLIVGWTGFGWLATLIWSFVDASREAPQVIIQQVYQAPTAQPSTPKIEQADKRQ